MQKTAISDIVGLLKKSSTVNIFSHTRPDGDTIGCAFALKRTLEQLGKTVAVYCDSAMPVKYAFLADGGVVFSDAAAAVKPDISVSVDCASVFMLGSNKALYFSAPICINLDHHLSNERYADYNYVEDRGAATEIIFELIKLVTDNLDVKTAELLLMGLITDTGNFSQSNTTENSLTVAAELVSKGANISYINNRMFKCHSKARSLLYADVISKAKFFHDDQVAIITVSLEQFQKFGAGQDETEGFIDFTLSIESVRVGVAIMQVKDKNFKISFRSKDVDVNQVASLYGGGGHIRASGCMLNGYLEDIIDKLVFNIGNYL